MIPRVVFNLHCNGFGNQTCGQIDNTVNNKVDKFVADEPLSVSGHDQSVLLGGTTHSNKASAVTKRPQDSPEDTVLPMDGRGRCGSSRSATVRDRPRVLGRGGEARVVSSRKNPGLQTSPRERLGLVLRLPETA